MEAVREQIFDLLIENVMLVNVFNDTVAPACIGISGKKKPIYWGSPGFMQGS